MNQPLDSISAASNNPYLNEMPRLTHLYDVWRSWYEEVELSDDLMLNIVYPASVDVSILLWDFSRLALIIR